RVLSPQENGIGRSRRRFYSSSPSPRGPFSIISSKSSGSSSPVSSATSFAHGSIALGSPMSPNLLGSATSSSDDSLERTRATREMSLRSFFPPQRVHLGSPESATTPTKKEISRFSSPRSACTRALPSRQRPPRETKKASYS